MPRLSSTEVWDTLLKAYLVGNVRQPPRKKGADFPEPQRRGHCGVWGLRPVAVTSGDRLVMVLVSDGDRMVMLLVGDGDWTECSATGGEDIASSPPFRKTSDFGLQGVHLLVHFAGSALVKALIHHHGWTKRRALVCVHWF